ncbi:MAG: DNA-3-methyladenine glycosylase I [Alphaproteobacteria bacterium]
MKCFAPILARAQKRAGGSQSLEELLLSPVDAEDLRAMADDRYFSLMSLRVFRAGLKHSMVDARWPAFEEVFHGFNPRRVWSMNDEELERLMDEKRIIRHWGKIKATRENAAAMVVVMDEFGSFGAYLADWPADDIMGLWVDMTKRFSQLGGNSGPYFLRMAGKDSFLLTGDVVRALIEAGVIAKKPNTKDAKAATAAAFNQWAAETGRPLCQISRILALSVG